MEQAESDRKIEMRELLGEVIGPETEGVNKLLDRLVETVSKLIQQGKDELEKAYGGCRRCYGKGYSTQQYGLSGSDDFDNEGFVEPIRTHIVYCTCDRGKQLQELLSHKA